MSLNANDCRINDVFGSKKYYIDFYQRDYKWGRAHVDSLIDDLFYRFESEYDPNVDVTAETVDRFSWYYMSTFVVNEHEGKTFLVDGQQRFTTLSLLLIRLYRLAKKYELDEDTVLWLRNKIVSVGPDGRSYWMGDRGREAAFKVLLEGNAPPPVDELPLTVRNLYQNYEHLRTQLDGHIQDSHKLLAFTRFLLQRVFLVEIKIPEPRDVAMVFEVINDRGEKLQPYEVFKGNLLGQLQKAELEPYLEVWNRRVGALQTFDERQIDAFFRTLFRARYVDNC